MYRAGVVTFAALTPAPLPRGEACRRGRLRTEDTTRPIRRLRVFPYARFQLIDWRAWLYSYPGV